MKYWIVFFILILGACAHHKDVRPGTEGVHWVSVKGDDPDAAAENALSQARHFCEEQDLRMGVVEEKNEYKGDMDEKEYNQAKRTSKAIQSAGVLLGGEAGRMARQGGHVASQSIGQGYRYSMKFKCL